MALNLIPNSSRPRLHMPHPDYPKVQIPAARVMGIGRHPALPAGKLVVGDTLVFDYGKTYKLWKKVNTRPQQVKLEVVSRTGDSTHRTVSLTAHVAVSWGTFIKRWSGTTPKTGETSMCKTGKKLKLSGRQIDLHTPINSGVSFNGKVDLTKQGGRNDRIAPKKVRLQKY